jgi:hypothetical protein
VGKLEDIAARNERALRDTKHKLVWVGVIVLALIAVGIAVAAGLGQPKVHHRSVTPQEPQPPGVPVLLRRAR